jgi:hypothetical protein
MSPAHRVSRITLWSLTGAVLGLVAGLLLKAVGVIDNPLWLTSAGLVAGAALSLGQLARPADVDTERRPADDEV